MSLPRSLWETRLNSEELPLLVHDHDLVFISIYSGVFSPVLIKTMTLRAGRGEIRWERGRGEGIHSGISCNAHITVLAAMAGGLTETP